MPFPPVGWLRCRRIEVVDAIFGKRDQIGAIRRSVIDRADAIRAIEVIQRMHSVNADQ